MKKVDFTKLNSANISVDNHVDESRVYNINARVNLNDGNLQSIDGGVVRKGNDVIATFSSTWSNEQNVSYKGVLTREEKCDVTFAIDDFIADTKTEIETNPIEL